MISAKIPAAGSRCFDDCQGESKTFKTTTCRKESEAKMSNRQESKSVIQKNFKQQLRTQKEVNKIMLKP